MYSALWLWLALVYSTAAQPSGSLDLDRIKRATVFIYQVRSGAEALTVTCISSGTLISADGLIISNAHGVLPSQQCAGDTLIVSLNVDLAGPPIPKYRADIVNAAAGLDIALLRISRELDGRQIMPGSLPPLPFVELGNAAAVGIDDSLLVIGYPDLGNQPVDVARGTVTAFIAEPIGGSRAWFKTRAEIPGTMAGGGAYNIAGQLIGIATNAPLAGLRDTENCRFIADTNRDGLVNSSDSCVPTGDFISTIRPVTLAQSLIRGARLGLTVERPSAPAETGSAMDNPPRVSRLFFAPAIVDGLPASVAGALPANPRGLYLFFDYENMRPETVYEIRVSRDGIPDSVFSLPPVRFSGGESGLWHIGSGEQTWANGAYEFTLLINGRAAGSQQLLIGGTDSGGQFSDIIFGTLDATGNLIGNGSILPLGNVASAQFLYKNMQNGQDWAALWYFGGTEVARSSDAWSDGEQGLKAISMAPQGGLLPGRYRLELYIAGALSATSDFVVAGQPGAPLPQIFQNLRYSSADNPTAARAAMPATSFPSGIPALYALFDWQRIAVGTPWTLRWLVDDQVFFETTGPWRTVDSGADFTVALPNPPDGKFSLQLLVNNLKLAEAEALVGIGQLPIDRFAEFEGAILSGQVIDAATKVGIPSVTIVLVSEEYAANEFTWQQEQIAALATTDRHGNFQFARPLVFGRPYSIVIEADGYLPQSADKFEFKQDEPYIDITIELVRG